jgi:hypothetical protein
VSVAHRLLAAARGSGSFAAPPESGASGPYDPAWSPLGSAILTQIHCHTTQSDGSYSAASVVSQYLAKGYGALALTDHDKVTNQPAGVDIAISGNELSPTTQHIISLDSTYVRGGVTDAQTLVDGVVADGGKVQIAHPKWYRGMTYAELAALTDWMGFEIHNMKCVNGAGQNPVSYPGYAVDLWDQMLTGVRRDIWGFAVDDLHNIDAFNALDVGRLQVFAETEDVAGIMAALASGNFAADVSNYGVAPGWPDRSDEGISIACTGAIRIEAWGSGGLLAAANSSSLDYAFTGLEHYVRLVAVGEYAEPFDSLSDRWYAANGSWAVPGGVLALTSTGTICKIVLRRHRDSDFACQVDMKIGALGTDQAGLMFNVLNDKRYYLLRIGASSVPSWNNVLAVGYTTNDLFGDPLASATFDPDPDTWYTVKMAYTSATGLIQAKVWPRADAEPGSWMLSVADTHWRHGGFGFRANQVAEFDNFYASGFRTFYQPVAVDLV